MQKPTPDAPPVAVLLSKAANHLAAMEGYDNAIMELTSDVAGGIATRLDKAIPLAGHPKLRQLDYEAFRIIFFVGTARELAKELKENVRCSEGFQNRPAIFIIAAFQNSQKGDS